MHARWSVRVLWASTVCKCRLSSSPPSVFAGMSETSAMRASVNTLHPNRFCGIQTAPCSFVLIHAWRVRRRWHLVQICRLPVQIAFGSVKRFIRVRQISRAKKSIAMFSMYRDHFSVAYMRSTASSQSKSSPHRR